MVFRGFALLVSGTGVENSLLQGLHVKRLVFIQGNGKVQAVLVNQFLVDDEGQRFNFAFHIVIVTFINAQPEHYLAFSACAYFCFAHANARVAAFFIEKRAQPGDDIAGHGNVHAVFSLLGRACA